MNGKNFKDWFFEKFVPTTKKFFREKKKLPEKAVLFIDNAPCHLSEEELRDCEISATERDRFDTTNGSRCD